MKDNFSFESSSYAKFRPHYPGDLFKYLKENLNCTEHAWDCGTGNGQVAGELAKFFKEVKATDISKQQLNNAVHKSNIDYSLQPAEKTNFPSNYFDIITVAQAIHWFNFDAFYKEAKRVLKTSGIIAIIGYSLFKSNSETDEVIHKFYNEIIGTYWDKERRYLDEKYQTIPFAFQEIESPEFFQEYQWTLNQLIGYLKTWSAVKHFEKANGQNPVDLITNELKVTFGSVNKVIFPILFRFGKLTN
ncbi:methyltransferase family protein [Salegentibacter sp. 24]|uniref:class I SAM-dependent methyltransferase n=1 Tax=Salegentibacter sp. 24 TaxID=2183986 RepID=UPI00105BFD81|nr:class I SAM-dependent methyltransferase [Salegentibacter sp. 24]TDN82397.1 methyltransferase family protein [Salegentibacter sp. 24]